MNLSRLISTTVLFFTICATGDAQLFSKKKSLCEINAKLHGTVLDFTRNHGCDRRICSAALQQKRDLYVYLPPGYDPKFQYPLMIYFHGFSQDEVYFLEEQLHLFDTAIACCKLPPMIIAWPDGSLQGRASNVRSASFFANSCAGRYEDFVMQDVWNFLFRNFPIRPECEAHFLAGASMGGSAAFRIAMEHRDRIRTAVGFMPALNLRWVDCRNRYRGNFDPCCWGWRTKLRPYEVIGVFYRVIRIRMKNLTDPMFGRGQPAIDGMSRINPIEVMSRVDLQPGQLNLFVAYGGKDEFNIDAHVESFLYCARQRGIDVGIAYDPEGTHSLETGTKLFSPAIDWLRPLVAPYSPPLAAELKCSIR